MKPQDYELYSTVWEELIGDIDSSDSFPQKLPLLAHYTSINTFERIVACNEVWFSNPLFMNDFEELRFGIFEGAKIFRQSGAIKEACVSDERLQFLLNCFEIHLHRFASEHALDVYAFCTSEHDPEKNRDGLLSMWRGYGGDGRGVAIVFDTSKFGNYPDAPLIVAPVRYATTSERLVWLSDLMTKFAELITRHNPSKDQLDCLAEALFDRIVLFSLFSKHKGFSEECEWRVVYLKDRDAGARLASMFDYAVGKNGIEPKLKLRMEPIPGVTPGDFSLAKIVHHIILGPSSASPMAGAALQRMLMLKCPNLRGRVHASTIPYRALS